MVGLNGANVPTQHEREDARRTPKRARSFDPETFQSLITLSDELPGRRPQDKGGPSDWLVTAMILLALASVALTTLL